VGLGDGRRRGRTELVAGLGGAGDVVVGGNGSPGVDDGGIGFNAPEPVIAGGVGGCLGVRGAGTMPALRGVGGRPGWAGRAGREGRRRARISDYERADAALTRPDSAPARGTFAGVRGA
jgi:hypothetical protein